MEVISDRRFCVGGGAAFEPGLTVRYALILVGGVDRTHGPENLSVAGLVELKAEFTIVSNGLAEVKYSTRRLQAELEDAEDPNFSDVGAEAPAAGENLIVSIDAELFQDRMTERSANQHHLLEMVEVEIDVQTRQARLQEAEISVQNDHLDNARRLVDQGLIPVARLQDVISAALVSGDALPMEGWLELEPWIAVPCTNNASAGTIATEMETPNSARRRPRSFHGTAFAGWIRRCSAARIGEMT